jgi:hypothetical protein
VHVTRNVQGVEKMEEGQGQEKKFEEIIVTFFHI